jgi:hypothetical protein
MSLHQKTCGLIERSGGSIESDEIGGAYNPYVSFLGHVGLEAGQTVQLQTLELVGKYQDGMRRVEHTFRFTGQRD